MPSYSNQPSNDSSAVLSPAPHAPLTSGRVPTVQIQSPSPIRGRILPNANPLDARNFVPSDTPRSMSGVGGAASARSGTNTSYTDATSPTIVVKQRVIVLRESNVVGAPQLPGLAAATRASFLAPGLVPQRTPAFGTNTRSLVSPSGGAGNNGSAMGGTSAEEEEAAAAAALAIETAVASNAAGPSATTTTTVGRTFATFGANGTAAMPYGAGDSSSGVRAPPEFNAVATHHAFTNASGDVMVPHDDPVYGTMGTLRLAQQQQAAANAAAVGKGQATMAARHAGRGIDEPGYAIPKAKAVHFASPNSDASAAHPMSVLMGPRPSDFFLLPTDVRKWSLVIGALVAVCALLAAFVPQWVYIRPTYRAFGLTQECTGNTCGPIDLNNWRVTLGSFSCIGSACQSHGDLLSQFRTMSALVWVGAAAAFLVSLSCTVALARRQEAAMPFRIAIGVLLAGVFALYVAAVAMFTGTFSLEAPLAHPATCSTATGCLYWGGALIVLVVAVCLVGVALLLHVSSILCVSVAKRPHVARHLVTAVMFIALLSFAMGIGAAASPSWATHSPVGANADFDGISIGQVLQCDGTTCRGVNTTFLRTTATDRCSSNASSLNARLVGSFVSLLIAAAFALLWVLFSALRIPVWSLVWPIPSLICFCIGLGVMGDTFGSFLQCGEDFCDVYALRNPGSSCGYGFSFAIAVCGALLTLMMILIYWIDVACGGKHFSFSRTMAVKQTAFVMGRSYTSGATVAAQRRKEQRRALLGVSIGADSTTGAEEGEEMGGAAAKSRGLNAPIPAGGKGSPDSGATDSGRNSPVTGSTGRKKSGAKPLSTRLADGTVVAAPWADGEILADYYATVGGCVVDHAPTSLVGTLQTEELEWVRSMAQRDFTLE